jgi:hypothetical protein
VYPKGNPAEGCKNRYDKVNHCTFCFNAIKGKISRHLLSKKHSDTIRTSEIKLLPKKSKERVVKLEILANEGNFKHNIKVLKAGIGHIVVARRTPIEEGSEEGRVPMDYLPCEYCFKFVVNRHLWSHIRKCEVRKYHGLPDPTMKKSDGNKGDDSDDDDGGIQRSEVNFARRGRSLLNSALYAVEDEKVIPILERMNNDEIKEIVRNDVLIKRFLQLRSESLGHVDDHKRKDVYKINQGARSLARLLQEARKSIPLITLDKLIHPSNFDLVVESTKKLCRLEEGENLNFGTKVGHLLGHISMIKSGSALRINDEELLKDATNFEILFKSEWNNRVNAVLKKRKHHLNISKRNEIPITKDLVAFRDYLCERMNVLCTRLPLLAPGSEKARQWSSLAKVTLCRLILFNKRRVSEISEITIASYVGRPNWTENSEEMNSALSGMEKEMAKRFAGFYCETIILATCDI